MNLLYLESLSSLDRITRYLENNEIDFLKREGSFFVLTERSSETFLRNLRSFLYLYNDNDSRLSIKVSPLLNDNFSKEEFLILKSSF